MGCSLMGGTFFKDAIFPPALPAALGGPGIENLAGEYEEDLHNTANGTPSEQFKVEALLGNEVDHSTRAPSSGASSHPSSGFDDLGSGSGRAGASAAMPRPAGPPQAHGQLAIVPQISPGSPAPTSVASPSGLPAAGTPGPKYMHIVVPADFQCMKPDSISDGFFWCVKCMQVMPMAHAKVRGNQMICFSDVNSYGSVSFRWKKTESIEKLVGYLERCPKGSMVPETAGQRLRREAQV